MTVCKISLISPFLILMCAYLYDRIRSMNIGAFSAQGSITGLDVLVKVAIALPTFPHSQWTEQSQVGVPWISLPLIPHHQVQHRHSSCS